MKMESKAITTKKIDDIQKSILQLVESKQASPSSIDDEHQLLLSQLLSQLESLKQDEVANQSEQSAETQEVVSGGISEVDDISQDQAEICKNDAGVGVEEVAKHLKKVEKQNRTTHWLLSALIVLTIAWQISEVSILLKLKNGFSHPFKSVGSMIGGMIKRRRKREEEGEQSSLLTRVNGSDSSLKLANMNLTGLINGDEE